MPIQTFSVKTLHMLHKKLFKTLKTTLEIAIFAQFFIDY